LQAAARALSKAAFTPVTGAAAGAAGAAAGAADSSLLLLLLELLLLLLLLKNLNNKLKDTEHKFIFWFQVHYLKKVGENILLNVQVILI
jgi:apolipoprotein N-acyltransferase